MVNLVKDYTNNQPLMEGHGAFSSVLGDTAAAMRYCITGDTLLLNSDSSLVKFKDIIEQSEEGTYNLKGKVLDFNGNEVNYSKYFNSGKHPVKRITLANGYEIKGTDNHPLLIIGINEKGEPSLEWKLIGDISYDDSIIIKRNNFNIPEVDKFNKLLAIFYGGMVAEGYISGEKQNYSRTGFSNQDKDYVDSVLDGFKILLTDSEFQKITRINPNKTSGSVYVIESHNTGLRNHLLEENFGINSYEREIPNKILNEGIGMHKWFLSSLFEGDGSVTTITTKTGNKEGSIDLHSVSLKLLKQVQVMLLNFNIISSITKSREAFRLQINKERDQINFKDKIGFLSKRKNESLNSLINSRSKNKKVKGVSMNDNIPYLSHFIRKNSVNKIREINRRAIGSYEKFNENLDLIKSSLNDQETLMNLEDFTNTVKDYSFFKVKEIKNLDQKETVYSIKVDSQDHSFLANGFINHNTEARLNKFSENYLLEDVNNNVVDMKPTFDSEDIEPVTLPAKLPLIFINGITGIGAGGFASSFPPHHTEAVINSTIALLKDNKVTVKDLIHKYNLKPAFPYGGYVDISNIEKIYSTGTGTFTTRATIERDTESDKKYDLLIVKDLPFLVTLESITNQIKEIHNDPKLKDHEKFLGLQDMQDQSHNVDIRLVLKYKKGTNLDLAIKSLYSKTSLQNFISFNPNMIKDENTLVEYTNV